LPTVTWRQPVAANNCKAIARLGVNVKRVNAGVGLGAVPLPQLG
jgi:hypothetical protein